MITKKTSCIGLVRVLIAVNIFAGYLSANEGSPAQGITPGLHVENSRLYLNGKEYRGMGINYFDSFSRMLSGNTDKSYKSGFKVLREKYNIPFIRFCAGGYWPEQWKLYLQNKDEYYKLMDEYVAEAEKQGLGLIPCLFWFIETVPDIAGEHMDQYGNPNSQTVKFLRQYTIEVVTRYKDSPAIWAWELGNEYMLKADIPDKKIGTANIRVEDGTPATRSDRDYFRRTFLREAYWQFADAVRSVDKYRMISSGDAMPRPYSYNLHTYSDWIRDSHIQWESILLGDSVGAMNSISAHIYLDFDKDYFEERLSLDELVPYVKNVAEKANKVFYIGEFGAESEKNKKEEMGKFQRLVDIIVKNNVPLSSVWVYDFNAHDQKWNITEKNSRAYMLDIIKDANKKIAVSLNSRKDKCSIVEANDICSKIMNREKDLKKPIGLYVNNGKLFKNEKEFRAVGVNYLDAFYRVITSQGNTDRTYKEGFRILKHDYNIPFIRFMAGGYWPVDWNLYFYDKEKYFQYFDELVAEAEKYQLGLIPSLIWYYASIPDLMGEHIADLEDSNSRSAKFIKEYVKEVVTRYRDKSVIWAWEVGNEYTISADLPAQLGMPPIAVIRGTRPFRTDLDRSTRKRLNCIYKYAVEEIRKLDTTRIISSGNAVPGRSAWHLLNENSWEKDNYEQYAEILKLDNIFADTISIHIYPDCDKQYFSDNAVIEELIEFSSKTAKKLAKPLFIGEFGSPVMKDKQKSRELFERIIKSIENNEVPLSALWVFNFPDQDGQWNVTHTNERNYMLDKIADLNSRLQKTQK
ncbi:MAG: cellulase family glycosylhydrolase [Phycisphaerae bacterium]|jgi:GH35 family endo-1,4-beta-xylanase